MNLYRLRMWRHELKWAMQRAFRGWDDTAVWSLNTYITEIALPVLKVIKEEKSGTPCNADSEKIEPLKEEAWNAILDKMILAFQILHDECGREGEYDFLKRVKRNKEERLALWERDSKNIKEGMALFAKYYQSLWT